MSKSFESMIKEAGGLYLIAEIGINHNGDLEIAKKLIDATHACGWHCAKFQKRNPDVCVPEHQKGVRRETPWGEMSYLEYKYKVEFEKEEYDYITAFVSEKDIHWSASVWDIDSLDFLLEYDLPFLKIPSAHITNHPLLSACAQSSIPLLLSTGMSDWGIIDKAVNILAQASCEYALMHCNSTYPAPHKDLNLRVINKMQERYQVTVGYSGHEHDLDPSIVAAGLGAEIIERHITLDHTMWGTDHNSSLEVHAMDILRKRISDIEVMLGSDEKTITASEIPIMDKLRT